jgi:hypothetical protein
MSPVNFGSDYLGFTSWPKVHVFSEPVINIYEPNYSYFFFNFSVLHENAKTLILASGRRKYFSILHGDTPRPTQPLILASHNLPADLAYLLDYNYECIIGS